MTNDNDSLFNDMMFLMTESSISDRRKRTQTCAIKQSQEWIYRSKLQNGSDSILSNLSNLSKYLLARKVLENDWLGDSGALGFDHVSEVARVSEIRIAVRVSVQFASVLRRREVGVNTPVLASRVG